MLFRIWLEQTSNKITLTGDKHKYLKNVLRLNVNDEFEVVASTETGKINIYKITAITNHKTEAILVNSYSEYNEAGKRLDLIQPLLKADKLEWVLQKTTEIGIRDFHLYSADSSPVKFNKNDNKLQRWQKIIESAVCQSRRGYKPRIFIHKDLRAALDHLSGRDLFWLNQSTESLPIGSLEFTEAAIAIGPESGFSKNEQLLLKSLATKQVILGKSTLRSETASISVCARLLI